MLSPDARAEDLSARLVGIGFSPRLSDHTDHTRIEAEVPEAVSPEVWRDLLELLEEADWFGLAVSSTAAHIVWAGIRKGPPRRSVPLGDQAIS